MRKVYSSQDVNLVHFAKSVLEANKIESVILREQLAGIVGGIAPLDAWPELWVMDDAKLEEVRLLLDSVLNENETSKSAWKCPGCGEMIESQFTQCWQCETEFKSAE